MVQIIFVPRNEMAIMGINYLENFTNVTVVTSIKRTQSVEP